MAEDSVIDYVILHELAHLIELNHSPRFWAIIGKLMPDYRERRKKLNDTQKRLNMENWDNPFSHIPIIP
jgi:predicted metal-dependent hydrolase